MKEPQSILIVDDNPGDIFITKRAISKHRADCIIESASDGRQAIDRLGAG